MFNTRTRKKKLDKKQVITSLICTLVGVTVGVSGTLITQDFVKGIKDNVSLTAAEIFNNAKHAVLEYDYARCTMNVINTSGDETEEYQYVVAGERDTQKKSLEMGSKNDGSIAQLIWERADDGVNFDIYTYATEEEVWVKESGSYVPFSFELYSLFTQTDNYKLLDEVDSSELYGDCYVLQYIVATDEYDELSEHVYISCDTFLPKCIVTLGISYTEDGEVADGSTTQEVQYYNESMVRYQFEYSDESLHLFEIPEKFITGEEYATYLESLEPETSEDNSEEASSEESSEVNE